MAKRSASMPKWGERRRDFAVILAVWPVYQPIFNNWLLHEFYVDDDKPPQWRPRQIEGEFGSIKGDGYRSRDSAFAAAHELNHQLRERLLRRNIRDEEKRSLELKLDKALTAKNRLLKEEELMLVAAKGKHLKSESHSPRVDFDDKGRSTADEMERFRVDLSSQLAEMPYLNAALVSGGKFSRFGTTRIDETKWQRPFRVDKLNATRIWRARISDAFNLNYYDHWGDTKAKIRQLLLPDATKLLLQKDVREMLAEALGRGEHVLVCNNVVFWYEPDENLGWQVKITSGSSDEGRTIWHEGKIISKNYGRIVVLPYIKENGEQVMGHTKNVAHEGPANPRKKENFLEIPFNELNGDLMIGLMGELYRQDYVGAPLD